jgi:hypothetical protein
VAAAYQALVADARAGGIQSPLLLVVSGFRDPRRQEQLWAQALRKYGSPEVARRWVAPPGHSAHQTGRAIDFYLGGRNSSGQVAVLRQKPAYHWLVANARRFGFYPYEAEPWHWEYNPPAGAGRPVPPAPGPTLRTATPPSTGGVAPLLGQQTTSSGRTIYLHLPLGGEAPAQPVTGIFVPTGFRPGPAVDIILYLHGHHRGGSQPPGRTVIELWDSARNPQWAFREGLANARKNAILVAPTLGPTSQAGRLIQRGGLDAFLQQVSAGLAAYGQFPQAPRLNNLILACHSGGGFPMRQLAIGADAAASRIRECWGFDCLYNSGDESLWPKWARARPSNRLFVYYLGSTAQRSQALARQRVSNIFVARSTARAHDWVPIEHWSTRLRDASVLADL